jgi:hypothetical protein
LTGGAEVAKLPSGTVTFLMTDIEGSTQLGELYPESMRPALVRHEALAIVATAGEGCSLVPGDELALLCDST